MVMGQVNRTYEAKEGKKIWVSKAHFVQVLREENMEANTLAKEASVSELTDEFDEIQYMPSIDLPEVQQIGGEEN